LGGGGNDHLDGGGADFCFGRDRPELRIRL